MIESAVMMECESEILSGTGGQKLKDYMRRVKGWQNDDTTVIIVLTPLRKASWIQSMKLETTSLQVYALVSID